MSTYEFTEPTDPIMTRLTELLNRFEQLVLDGHTKINRASSSIEELRQRILGGLDNEEAKQVDTLIKDLERFLIINAIQHKLREMANSKETNSP